MSIPDPSWPEEPPGSGAGHAKPNEPAGRGEPGVCELCGTPLGPADARCGACGMVVGVAKPAPSPFSHTLLWAVVGGVGVIYVIVLGLVAALR